MPVSTKPVLVTGASGFIASRIVEQLLARGYRVRGTVRSLTKGAEIARLKELPGANERLQLVPAELLAPGAFDDAARGVEYVMHTASPYVLDVKDPQRDLVDPAVSGTENVLEACAKGGEVKRVVLTSSMAAITDEPDGDVTLTENDWNTKSSLTRNPYYYSKTLAERAGWKFCYGTDAPPAGHPQSKVGFDLVAINPFMVVGPSLTPALNTSNQLFVDIMSGVYPGIMNLHWGFVDVRDVALSHVEAIERENAAGRYLCANESLSMRAVVEQLVKLGYGDRKLPKLGLDCGIGDYVVRLSSYTQPKGVGSDLRTHVGRTPRFDHGKLVRELGIRFLPLEQTIAETLKDLDKWGHLNAKAAS